MNVDPILAIGTGTTLVAVLGSAFIAIGKLFSRVGALEVAMKERAEERTTEREASERRERDLGVTLSALRGELKLLGDVINQGNVRAMERFAPIDDMRALGNKVDGLSESLSAIKTTQAEVRAKVVATAEGVADIKRALERRPP